MAKNTSSSAFRKIDVDQYSENNFKEDEVSTVDSGGVVPDENEVMSLVSAGKPNEALKIILSGVPRNTPSNKDAGVALALRVLLAVRPAQMDEVIAELNTNQLDTLMKYVYRGFELPSEGSSGHLLVWHEKVYAVAGVGSIVRVLTDTKRI